MAVTYTYLDDCDCCDPCNPIGGDCPELTSGVPSGLLLIDGVTGSAFGLGYDSVSGESPSDSTVGGGGLIFKFPGCVWFSSFYWFTATITRDAGDWVATFAIRYTGESIPVARTDPSEVGDTLVYRGSGDVVAGYVLLTYSSSGSAKWYYPASLRLSQTCLNKCGLDFWHGSVDDYKEVCPAAPPQIAVTLESSDPLLDGKTITVTYQGWRSGIGGGHWMGGYIDGPNNRLIFLLVYCDRIRNGSTVYDGYSILAEVECLTGVTYQGETTFYNYFPPYPVAYNYATPNQTTADLVCAGGIFLGETDTQTLTSDGVPVDCHGSVAYSETIKFHLLG